MADDYLACDVYVGSIGGDSVAGGHGDDTLKGNGACWTTRNNPASDDQSRSYSDENDRDTIDGGYGDEFINDNAGLNSLDRGQERHHAPSSAGIVLVRAVPRRRFGGCGGPGRRHGARTVGRRSRKQPPRTSRTAGDGPDHAACRSGNRV